MDQAAEPPRRGPAASPRALAVVVGVALLACAVTAGAMLRTSATFDEIVLVAGGLRGLERGAWDMVTGQPPVMMYLYGGAARTAGPSLPVEDGSWTVERGWAYARAVFFGQGNDPVGLLRRARWVGVAAVGVLVVTAGLWAAWITGPVTGLWAAVLAAIMVAGLPDVLAHGGVAYNDLPLALAFLVALWALDGAVRHPTPLRAAGTGLAVAVALGVKLSALALAPVAALLVAAEAAFRGRDRAWWRDVAVSVAVGVLALWAGLMVLYRGDPTLTLFRLGIWRTVLHTEGGHPAPAYFMGAESADGWWWFYPVVFFFKTPAAFQALVALGGGALLHGARRVGRAGGWRRLAAWRGRAALLGLLVFGFFLLRSHLDSGFRYALPVLPLLAVLAAAGLARLMIAGRRMVAAVAALVVLQVASVLTAYPHLLAYTSVWAGSRDGAHRVLVDSSLDWGQGLLQLRRFMEREGVSRVALAYFGSAAPEAYGIEYQALPSFFRLEKPSDGPAPRFTVISATLLHGLYLQGHDPYAAYRDRTPDRVLGHTLLVYDEEARRAP